jgi:DNA-directed RNA polymerase specialized sigma24 family protein
VQASPTQASGPRRQAPRPIPGRGEELVAAVSSRKRQVLLRVYRDRLPAEDLEDCYSQATIELLLRARLAAERRGRGFESAAHVANALEQKLRSRIQDRRRALGGRSAIEAALASALRLGAPEHGGVDVADIRPATEDAVAARLQLRGLLRLARRLSADQRLVLGACVELDLTAREFCERAGWSLDKYRKVDQRARARLRALAAETAQTPAGTPAVPPAVGASDGSSSARRGRALAPRSARRPVTSRGPGCSPPAPPAACATVRQALCGHGPQAPSAGSPAGARAGAAEPPDALQGEALAC